MAIRVRGSVDRASGSGPEERGFESLRTHNNKIKRRFSDETSLFDSIETASLQSKQSLAVHLIYLEHRARECHHSRQYVDH
jgi:hypothetical protein